jgi:HD-like signal output (HDOD) protein
MKKRILFVDDERMVLKGIERSLWPMRGQWDMCFDESGARACEHLARKECDLVVTDMMMPDMDGSEVLAFAKEKAPKTIRLVLSGHADQKLTMKCIGLAHQYISKPCDGETLVATIKRLTDPAFAIRNEQLMTIVSRLNHLPSLPALYTRMILMLRDPNASVEDVGALIASDMAMTAKILQLVNSSFFGLSRHITKPMDAAAYLGMDTLKALVLAANVFTQFESRMPVGFSAEKLASHSHSVGAAARAIAKAEHASKAVVEEALVAGLLHDVGKLVLASSLPEQYQQMAETIGATPLKAERAIFGATHAEVGGCLLGLWGLPPAVVEAISLHHTPGRSQNHKFSALTATHVANALVGTQPVSVPDIDYLTRLGLADRLPVWRSIVGDMTSPAT